MSIRINDRNYTVPLLSIMFDFFMEDYEEYDYIILNATFYDKNNNIIDTSSDSIHFKNFLGFETLKLELLDEKVKEIEKIRLYLKIG